MRLKLSFAVPMALTLLFAAEATGQNVPVTMTMWGTNSPIDSIQFVTPPSAVFPVTTGSTIQHFAGLVSVTTPATNPSYYKIKAKMWVGGSTKLDSASVAQRSTCTLLSNGQLYDEGSLVRISCSVVQRGLGLVCSGVYSGQPPQESCEGTYACKKCDRIRVCGSDPQCNN